MENNSIINNIVIIIICINLFFLAGVSILLDIVITLMLKLTGQLKKISGENHDL